MSKPLGPDPAALFRFMAGAWQKEERLIHIEAQGASMFPLIRARDRLALRLMAPDRLRRGEVFAFLREGRIVVHRLIGTRRTGTTRYFCQKGDGLSGWSWVEEGAVLGRVEKIMGRGKTLDLLRRPWSWVNPTWACLWFAWITVYEKMKSLIDG